jgi:hypothetical protein
MALSIDGSASNTATTSTAPTVTLSTTLANDIIVVALFSAKVTTPATVTTISDTAGLTWAKRSSRQYLSGTQDNLEVWWALSSGILSSDVITVNLNSAPSQSTLIAFGVNGADLTSPWDPNASLPVTASGTGVPSVSGVSTTKSNTILLAFEGHSSTTADTAGIGFSLIKAQAAGSLIGSAAQSQVVSSPQSSVTVAFGTSFGGTVSATIADAIKESTGGQAQFSGAGSLSVNVTQITTTKLISATFAGAGSLSARLNAPNIRAQFSGAGNLQATVTGGVVGVTAAPPFVEKKRLALTYVELDIPEFPPTFVLLHFDDINSPPTVIDSNTAGSNHVWTASGNATISSGTFKFGTASLLLDGTGDFSTTPDSDDFTLGDNDFTIDCWFNCNSPIAVQRDLAGQQDAALTPALSAWALVRNSSNAMRFQAFVGSTTFTINGTTQFTNAINTGWHHLAAVRIGNVLKLLIDGIQEGGDVAITGSINDSTAKLGVGTLGDGSVNPWLGSIDEFRFTAGVARWSANFAVPTAADSGLTTFRFAIDNLYLPSDIKCIPNITDVKVSPAIASLGENLGQRASITVSFRDHKHIFALESFDSGTFWGKFRARYGLKLQGRILRLIQGFVGQSLATMETRTYVIESVDGPSTTGEFKIVGKDLFKLADGDRAQAPIPSNGFLSANITNVATSLTLAPTGIGSEYPASGYVNIGGSEIVSFTRSGDVLTITRAQYNTLASAHDAQSRVQLCLRYSAASVADIIYDLMVTYAGIDPTQILLNAWIIETNAYSSVGYSALIAEPTSVNKLISELVEQAGLVLWWDDLGADFHLQVLRAISTDAFIYDEDNIISQSLKVTEQLDKRISQVYVYFDKINPLINEDQLENYRSTAFDSDPQAEIEYGAVAIKKIYSRWIPTGARTVADNLIATLMARFRDPPRRINFDIFRDEAGATPTMGAGYQIGYWCFQDVSGNPALIPVQFTSINATPDLFEIEAQEVLFTGGFAPMSPDVHTIIIDANVNNANLQTIHDSIYPAAVSGVTVNCTIQQGVIVGSLDTANPAFTVGTFAAGVTVNLIVNGRIQGKAGNGGNGTNLTGGSGLIGGPALYTRQNINLTDTSGQIWGGGGGGGGGGSSVVAGTLIPGSGGGGGAGQLPGAGGLNGGSGAFDGQSGTTEAGGAGGTNAANPFSVGGTGGNPGLVGSTGTVGSTGQAGGTGGAPGKAIDGIAFVTTIGGAGDRRGGTI